MDFRKIEKCAEQDRSRTKELLWSWAHKNKTVGDLLEVLQEMGNLRAITLFEETNVLSRVNFEEITEATLDFNKDFMIREGCFFDIFKAEVKKEVYVIKRLKQKNQDIDEKTLNNFMSKWTSLPRIEHVNILKLVGWFTKGGFTCLVYPNMINGSLFRILHCADITPPLPWRKRYNILLGIAHAISYLHTINISPVICGNISSKNILLDQHFQPKLSDFAMVHLRSYLINHSYTIKMDHATLRFLGYLPEEYIRRGELSLNTDVYSYGVVIMEVFSGSQVVLDGLKFTYLRDMFWNQVEKSGVESLLQFVDVKAKNWPIGIASILLDIAIKATSQRAKKRPTMEMVLEMIESCRIADKSTDDQPMTLMSVPPYFCPLTWSSSNVPVESDEYLDTLSVYESLSERKCVTMSPCECSQSEVTYLGGSRKCKSAENVICTLTQGKNTSKNEDKLQMTDLSHKSRPVECSCSLGLDSTPYCEECLTNGFGHTK
ncbi:interleukin-1 receptor-associated kinase 3 isoform X2 [Hyla sarda]|nr:interleukin-1 receptor-associated kinase 3 isoform X2 [Hyla sarda]XP_056430220.1 interleukin-1 receptor-associated kinase 3 isoform X2 [Hyla sarda]XP_056430221.1 interleukin-1 receptor-associated kinase 3 isoform X2 [Hyla sarda]